MKSKPVTGDIWEHVDGGSMFVVFANSHRVIVQRRPFGDSLAEPFTLRLGTFAKRVTRRLKPDDDNGRWRRAMNLVGRLRVTEKAKLDELRRAGSMMSNYCYNLSQRVGSHLSDEDKSILAEMYKHWDAVKRSTRPAAKAGAAR